MKGKIALLALLAGAVLTGIFGCGDKYELTVLAVGMNGCEVIGESRMSVGYGEELRIKLDIPAGQTVIQVLKNGSDFDGYTLTGDTLTVGSITSPATFNIISGNPKDTCVLVTDLNSTLGGKVSSSIKGWEIPKGSIVRLTAETNDGGVFLGWQLGHGSEYISENEQIVVSADSNALYRANFDDSNVPIPVVPELSAPAQKKYTKSVNINYHLNGGVEINGSDVYTQTFGLDFYTIPNALPDNGAFVREGYVLLGYSTDPNGKSNITLPGHKLESSAQTELYCVWQKAEPTSSFTYTEVRSGEIRLDSYSGSSDKLYVPRTINGRKVVEIGKNCFAGSGMSEVYLPATITNVKEGAFSGCDKLTKITLFDRVTEISKAGIDTARLTSFNLGAASYPRYSTSDSSFGRKYERLIDCDMPRVVVVSGSSKFFGLNSDYAEEMLGGKYRVVNYGTHAGMNILIFFDFISKQVTDGDIVIYAPEQYAKNTTGTSGNPELNALTFQGVESCYNILSYIDPRNYTKLFESLEEYDRQRLSLKEQNYEQHGKNTDIYGDNCADKSKMNSPSYHKNANGTFRFCDNFFIESFIPNMNRAIETAQANGALVYFSHPPYNRNACDPKYLNDESYDAYHAYLDRVLSAELISDVRNYIFGGEYFYNTDYHLNDAGTKIHTEQLIADLLAKLGEKNDPGAGQ